MSACLSGWVTGPGPQPFFNVTLLIDPMHTYHRRHGAPSGV